MMVRGVNKNVIEISDTGNDCFERAILFLRPESAAKGGEHVRGRAADYLAGLRLRRGLFPKRRLVGRVVGWLIAAGVGAALTAAFTLL